MKYFVTILVIVLIAAGWVGYTNIKKSPTPVITQADVSLDPTQLGDSVEVLHEGPLAPLTFLFKPRGTARLLQVGDVHYLELNLISMPPFPDLMIYLAKQDLSLSAVKLQDYVSIGKVRKNDGTQIYLLPDNDEDFSTVVIWSRVMDLPIASWKLQ